MAASIALAFALLNAFSQWQVPRHSNEVEYYRSQIHNSDSHWSQNVPKRRSDQEIIEDFICPQRYGRFSHPLDCKKYIECRQGRPIVRTCEHDLHFNQELGCTVKSLANCKPDYQCPPYEEVGCEQPEGCLTCEHREPCPTFVCKEGCVCEAGYYRSTRGICVHEDECSEQIDFTCPRDYGRFQYPGDCHKYYQCHKGEAKVRTCLGGLEFDENFECILKSSSCV